MLEPSLSEAFRSIEVPGEHTICWKKLLSYLGPGALVAVGYMDPGNWSTDLAAGSAYGYRLLFVVLLSSLIAMFLQCLAVKAGVGYSRDLAQICRDNYSSTISTFLWLIMETAIAATDLAEVIGGAIAFKLLFGIPLVGGILMTAADVLIVLFMRGSHIRTIEAIILVLVLIIGVCLVVELSYSKPAVLDVLLGFLPRTEIVTGEGMLFVSIGIIGATVMPHNLFLHSSLILTRASRTDAQGQIEAVRYATFDTIMSLFYAFFVNAALLIVSASAFYVNGYTDIATLQDAYHLLQPVLGGKGASILFGTALLASGQSATFTGNFLCA